MPDDLHLQRLYADLQALQELSQHPGWRLLAERLQEQEQKYDSQYHTADVNDIATMARLQTYCRVYREAATLPETLFTDIANQINQLEGQEKETNLYGR